MAENWDDSDDDEWDASDSELDAKLGLNKLSVDNAAPAFDDEEEDLAVKEKERAERASRVVLKNKGNALKMKKELEEQRKIEEEAALQALEAEAELEANMTPDERRRLQNQRVEEADNALTDDLFGGVDAPGSKADRGGVNASDTVKMKDLKDHLMHAKKVSQCIKVRASGKVCFLFSHLIIRYQISLCLSYDWCSRRRFSHLALSHYTPHFLPFSLLRPTVRPILQPPF